MQINFSENFFSSSKVLLNLSQSFYSSNFLSVLLRSLKKQNKTKKTTKQKKKQHKIVALNTSVGTPDLFRMVTIFYHLNKTNRNF